MKMSSINKSREKEKKLYVASLSLKTMMREAMGEEKLIYGFSFLTYG